MDDQRQPGDARGGDVAAEPGRLRLARRVVIVVVEPGFADRHDLRVAGDADELVDRDVGLLGGVVRVGADRAIDLGVAVDDRLQAIEAPDPGRYADDRADARGPRPLDDRIAVRVELGEIEMAVAVDEHRSRRSKANPVMPGLVPGIHANAVLDEEGVDGRDNSGIKSGDGHDGGVAAQKGSNFHATSAPSAVST